MSTLYSERIPLAALHLQRCQLCRILRQIYPFSFDFLLFRILQKSPAFTTTCFVCSSFLLRKVCWKTMKHKQCSDWMGDEPISMHNRKLAPIFGCKPGTSVDRVTMSLQHGCEFSVRFSTIDKTAARGFSPKVQRDKIKTKATSVGRFSRIPIK